MAKASDEEKLIMFQLKVMKGGSIRLPSVFREFSGLNHNSIVTLFWNPMQKAMVITAGKVKKIEDILPIKRADNA